MKKIFLSENGCDAIVLCEYGNLSHGSIKFTTYTYIQNENEDGWTFLQFKAYPSYSHKFWGRVKNAWNIFWGNDVEVDLFLSLNETMELAEFLKTSCDKFHRKSKGITLSDLRKIISMEPRKLVDSVIVGDIQPDQYFSGTTLGILNYIKEIMRSGESS